MTKRPSNAQVGRRLERLPFIATDYAGVAKLANAADLESAVLARGLVGSNPIAGSLHKQRGFGRPKGEL
jgi:hypothetical protein